MLGACARPSAEVPTATAETGEVKGSERATFEPEVVSVERVTTPTASVPATGTSPTPAAPATPFTLECCQSRFVTELPRLELPAEVDLDGDGTVERISVMPQGEPGGLVAMRSTATSGPRASST